MATRSTISIENEDGTIQSIYCHSDGYLSHNGKLLLEHYTSKEKVLALTALGDISVLDENIEPFEVAKAAYYEGKVITKTEHKFGNRQEGVLIAYHRDRDEPLRIDSFKDFEEYTKSSNLQGYDYIFKVSENKWYVCFDDIKGWVKLTQQMVDEE